MLDHFLETLGIVQFNLKPDIKINGVQININSQARYSSSNLLSNKKINIQILPHNWLNLISFKCNKSLMNKKKQEFIKFNKKRTFNIHFISITTNKSIFSSKNFFFTITMSNFPLHPPTLQKNDA
jgi:hypothetical protein